MSEFNEIRDSIVEINDQLDSGDKMSDMPLCDHYLGLINSLNNHGLRIALEVKLATNKVPIGDVEQTIVAITQVLTSFLISDEVVALEADSSRMLVAKDAKKSGIKSPAVPPPNHPCKFCGRMHWEKTCFKNILAGLETQKKASKLAPSSPPCSTRLAEVAATSCRAAKSNRRCNR